MTRIDLHSHSEVSDGELTPEALADRLHAAGVAIASLTDHDHLDGLSAFQERLGRHGVGFIPGVEISTRHRGREVHLLGYGFNPGDSALSAALLSLRQSRKPALQNLQQSAQQGARYLDWETGDKEGDLSTQTAIAILHAAGGKAFLAHPRVLGDDLDGWCRELKALGLDGLEAYYGPYSTDERESLVQLADRHGLLVSGGTDWHGYEGTEPGIDMPHGRWRAFLDAVCFQSPAGGERPPPAVATAAPAPGGRWLRFGARFVLPSLLALGLFITALFAVLLPMFEGTLMERKRELIRELARSAVSIAADREREVREGRLGDRQARDQAKERIGALRYGREGKDYFWIQDLSPRMVMHPWRPDLDGRDLSEFKDARGQRLFVAFADLVRQKGEGYARYVWQWKDDPKRLAPKESYVLGFEPWGWVIGTGMYTDDVRAEIARLERGVLALSLAIALLVGGFLAWLVWQSLRLERERTQSEDRLRDSHERFRALVEAAREGTLHVRAGRCLYANPTLLEWLGYRAAELPLLHFRDLIDDPGENAPALRALDALEGVGELPPGCEAVLRRRDGQRVPCALGFSRMGPGLEAGFVVLVRALFGQTDDIGEEERLTRLSRAADAIPMGVFRARTAQSGLLLAMNRAARGLFSRAGGAPSPQSLEEIFPTGGEWASFQSQLEEVGRAQTLLSLDRETEGTRRILISGEKARAPEGEAGWMDGTVRDAYAEWAIDEARGRLMTRGLVDEIETATDAISASRTLSRAKGLARVLMEGDARPLAVSTLLAEASDAAVGRLIALAQAELGPAPAPFAFLALGSHGRREQTLGADQDNALLHGDLPVGAPDSKPYFLEVAKRVCEGLERGGHPLCKGGSNALNPAWCRSLAEWKATAQGWIERTEPHDLMELAIFFDYRAVSGDPALVGALREGVTRSLASCPAFYPRFAQNGLAWKAPVRVFGKRLGAETAGLDLKRCLMPIIHGVRLYALREGVEAGHTLDRLRDLAANGCFSRSERAELELAWLTLTRLRLKNQAESLDEGGLPGRPAADVRLAPGDGALLHHAFDRIEMLQKRLERDFLGG